MDSNNELKDYFFLENPEGKQIVIVQLNPEEIKGYILSEKEGKKTANIDGVILDIFDSDDNLELRLPKVPFIDWITRIKRTDRVNRDGSSDRPLFIAYRGTISDQLIDFMNEGNNIFTYLVLDKSNIRPITNITATEYMSGTVNIENGFNSGKDVINNGCDLTNIGPGGIYLTTGSLEESQWVVEELLDVLSYESPVTDLPMSDKEFKVNSEGSVDLGYDPYFPNSLKVKASNIKLTGEDQDSILICLGDCKLNCTELLINGSLAIYNAGNIDIKFNNELQSEELLMVDTYPLDNVNAIVDAPCDIFLSDLNWNENHWGFKELDFTYHKLSNGDINLISADGNDLNKSTLRFGDISSSENVVYGLQLTSHGNQYYDGDGAILCADFKLIANVDDSDYNILLTAASPIDQLPDKLIFKNPIDTKIRCIDFSGLNYSGYNDGDERYRKALRALVNQISNYQLYNYDSRSDDYYHARPFKVIGPQDASGELDNPGSMYLIPYSSVTENRSGSDIKNGGKYLEFSINEQGLYTKTLSSGDLEQLREMGTVIFSDLTENKPYDEFPFGNTHLNYLIGSSSSITNYETDLTCWFSLSSKGHTSSIDNNTRSFRFDITLNEGDQLVLDVDTLKLTIIPANNE